MRENLHRPLANIRTLCGLLLVAVLGNTSISIMASTVALPDTWAAGRGCEAYAGENLAADKCISYGASGILHFCRFS